jgi:hypothetical protein
MKTYNFKKHYRKGKPEMYMLYEFMLLNSNVVEKELKSVIISMTCLSYN